ncbi:tyrosine-type recombinase/integrase [Streptodolium elevatio]
MSLAAVRALRPELRLTTTAEVEAFEQDLLSEFVLARASAGMVDKTIRQDLSAICEVREWLGRPLWEMSPQDVDRFFGGSQRALLQTTKVRKAQALAIFFEFLELRHQAEIHAATGVVVESPLDEVNRPRGTVNMRLRIPPSAAEVERLFGGWRDDLESARKYAPTVRSYTAMRLTSMIGPRVSELCLADVSDIHWHLGRFGKILLKGKGTRGRKKERLVPLINGARELLEWWVQGPRWEFDDEVNRPGAPLFPSERREPDGTSRRVDDDTLRNSLAQKAASHLPGYHSRLTPHVLRHFAASDLYLSGMDIVALQELLGHEWLHTTMIYVHVTKTHIEDAWLRAGQRAGARLEGSLR